MFLIGTYYLNREFKLISSFIRLFKCIPGASEEIETFLKYYSFQEVQYRWRNFRVRDLKYDTLFSIFVFTLLASFVALNLPGEDAKKTRDIIFFFSEHVQNIL